MCAAFIIGKHNFISISFLYQPISSPSFSPFFLFYVFLSLSLSLSLFLSLSLSLFFSCRLPGLVNIGLASVYPNLPEYTDIIPPTVEVIGDLAHV